MLVGVLRAILELRNDLSPELKRATNDLKRTRPEVAKTSAGLRGLGGAAKAAAGAFGIAFGVQAVGSFLRSAVEMRTSMAETQNLFEVSFGSMTARAEEWASRTAAALGTTEDTLKSQSAQLFLIAQDMGVTKEASFQMSTGLVQLAQDMASLRNVDVETAFEAIKGGITGETERLKSLGIVINETAVKETEYAKAILETGRQLTTEEKAIARVQAILQRTKADQGDLIRTQESAANATRRLSETWKQFLGDVGAALEPAALAVTLFLDRMISGAVGMDAFNTAKGFVLLFAAEFVQVFSDTLPAALIQFLDVAALMPGTIGEMATSAADGMRNLQLSALDVASSLREQAGAAFLEVTAVQETNGAAVEALTAKYDIMRNSMDEYESSAQRAAGATQQAAAALPSLAVPLEVNRRRTVDMSGAVTDYDRRMAEAWARTRQQTSALGFLGGVLSSTSSLTRTLGVESDSTFGKMLGWAQTIFDAFSGFLGLISQIAGGIGGIGGLLGNLGGLGGGVAGGGGGGLGGLLGGIGGLIPGGGLALGLGAAAIGGIGALLGGIGGGRDPGTVQDEALRDMGVNLPKDLAQSIHDSGLNPQAFVGAMAQAGLLSGENLAREIGDIFSVLEQGKLTSDQAQQALNDALPSLIAQLQSGELDASSEQVQRIVGAADRFGLEIPALIEALKTTASAPPLPTAPGVPASSPPPAGSGAPGAPTGGAPQINLHLTIQQTIEGLFAGDAEAAARISADWQERNLKSNPEVKTAILDLFNQALAAQNG